MDSRDPSQIPDPRLPVSELLARLPGLNVGRFGRPGDPWNLLFLGPESALSAALEAGGWTRLAGTYWGSIVGGLGQLARGRRLTLFPPMNYYEQFGRFQDHNWVLVTTPILQRHHFRLWKTPYTDPEGRQAWWGSANYDMAARFWDFSHVPDPDADAERDFIGKTLVGAPQVSMQTVMPSPNVPRSGANDKGYPYFTDGRVLVVQLTGR